MRVSKYGTYKNEYLRALSASYPFSTPYEFLTDRQDNMCTCITLSCKISFLPSPHDYDMKDANPGLIQPTYSFKPGLRLIDQFE